MRNSKLKIHIFIDYPGSEETMFFLNFKYTQNGGRTSNILAMRGLDRFPSSEFEIYFYPSDDLRWIDNWMKTLHSYFIRKNYIGSVSKLERRYSSYTSQIEVIVEGQSKLTLFNAYPSCITFEDNRTTVKFSYDHSDIVFY